LDSESDSDVPTTSSHKQLWPCAIVVTSDNETSTEEEEISELEISDDKTSDIWCKTDKQPTSEPFFGTTGLHIVIDNPESVVEVVSSVISEDLVPEEMRKFLGLIILMGQVRKEYIRDCWSTDPTISTCIFPRTVSRNHFESIW
jgi:hypothetical protein